jgi:hypothetical protein
MQNAIAASTDQTGENLSKFLGFNDTTTGNESLHYMQNQRDSLTSVFNIAKCDALRPPMFALYKEIGTEILKWGFSFQLHLMIKE